jgi:hypothetical protein
LGISTWRPWKDIYTQLPERIYAKLLATGDMEIKYKPEVCLSSLFVVLDADFVSGPCLPNLERHHHFHVS